MVELNPYPGYAIYRAGQNMVFINKRYGAAIKNLRNNLKLINRNDDRN